MDLKKFRALVLTRLFLRDTFSRETDDLSSIDGSLSGECLSLEVMKLLSRRSNEVASLFGDHLL